MDEINSLHKNDTIEIIERPAGCRVLGLKWVFKIKEHIDGTIARYKVRCTALGNLQREGFDYQETFAPVVRYCTVRILLAISVSRGYFIHQMDVDTAFLYGEMTGPAVYIEVPADYPLPEHLVGKTNLVARVKKSLYGLKQAPRLWNDNIHACMTQYGFERSPFDACLYYRERGPSTLYVALYVDDLIIAGNTLEAVNEFKREMSKKYNMKDLGELRYCLGMEVMHDRTNSTLTIAQSKYCTDVLQRFGMSKANPAPTPLPPGIKLSKSMAPKTDEEKVKAEKFPYREIVGSLMYLMVSTRPDIAHAVGILSKYMNCHGSEHHAAAIHLLRYIKGTKKLGITYRGTKSPLEFTGYSDADWAADLDTRRSTTAYLFMLAGGPVSWASKSQSTVALSSTRAEYMALTAASKDAMMLKNIGRSFHINAERPITVYEDNQGAIAMSSNPSTNSSSKHISIKEHFVREKVADGDITIKYLKTTEMLADALTKSLAKITLFKLRDVFMGGRE